MDTQQRTRARGGRTLRREPVDRPLDPIVEEAARMSAHSQRDLRRRHNLDQLAAFGLTPEEMADATGLPLRVVLELAP